MTGCRSLFGERGCDRVSLLEPPNPRCPWHGLHPCKGGCGVLVWGDSHYVPSVGHYSDPSDAITPYYTCQGAS